MNKVDFLSTASTMRHTIKRHIIFIICTMILSCGIIVSLAWQALNPIYIKNGFSRSFLSNSIETINKIEGISEIAGISGATSHQIYFKTKDPSKLYTTDYDLQNGKFIELGITNKIKPISIFYCSVDSPDVHIMAGNDRMVIRASLSHNATSIYNFPSHLFTRAINISSNTYIFRGFDGIEGSLGQIFFKSNPATKTLTKKIDFLVDRHDMSGIKSDGQLNYDKETNLITYVSAYNNSVYCIDTNLNVVYKGRTIDTTNSVQIKTGLENNHTATNLSPTRIINGKNVVSKGTLYVASRLMADNEPPNLFNNNIVIDTYSIINGKYKGSFYIPKLKRERVKDFKVLNGVLVVLYDNQIALYKMP